MDNQKRYFFCYGWLEGIQYNDYLNDLLYWVYEDSDPDDGTLICSNTETGEWRYVIGSGDYVQNT